MRNTNAIHSILNEAVTETALTPYSIDAFNNIPRIEESSKQFEEVEDHEILCVLSDLLVKYNKKETMDFASFTITSR